MPKLIRLYIWQVCLGFLLSGVFVGLLLWLDVAGLGGLIARSSVGGIAVLMLWVFNGIVFAGVQFAIRIMWMQEEEPPQGGTRQAIGPAVPVKAEASARKS